MRIIGKTKDGYLIEAAPDEIAKCAGYSGVYYVPDEKWRHHGIPVGTVINVSESWNWLQGLRNAEKGVQGAAKFMRQLADHVEAGLPSTIVPPPTEEHGQ